MGPLINERQRDKVDGMVQRAVADARTLVTGGKRLDPGYFYAPTLLSQCRPRPARSRSTRSSARCWSSSDSTMTTTLLRIANNSILRSVPARCCSADQDRALAVALRIRTGSFSINGGNYLQRRRPVRGFKQSGVGREMGVAGLEEFLERKTFAVPVPGVAG